MTSIRLLLLPVAIALLASACGGSGWTPLDTPFDTTMHMYEADDPNIQYTGRIDFGNAKLPRFALGSTYITARFKGVGVSVLLKDEHRYGKWRNYYDAVVDGEVVSTIRINDDVSMYTYTVASNLVYGEHEVTIIKRTEPNVGVGYFLGFEIQGVIVPPPARHTHKLVIFGDSITAGSGIDVPADGDPGCTADEWGQSVQNADEGYGPVAARMLYADYHVVGISGIGLVRDYNSDPSMGDTHTMPQVYNLLFPEPDPRPSLAVWTPASFQPEAIVVALGTNDFSPGPLNADNTPKDGRAILDAETFATTYVSFVDTLRADYPAAHIFLMSSPMLVDGWPTASYQSKTSLLNALAMVEDHYVTAGDTKLHTVMVSRQGGGCAAHPNVAGQAATGLELATAMKATLGW
jgi:lysophospholipase L1-like esterase